MKYLLLFAILVFTHATNVFAERKCFQNDALQGLQIVNLELVGKKVAGTFEHENGENELARKYKFSGTTVGNVLRVKFENGELPDVAPSEMRNLNWKFGKRGGGEVLLIPFYGKNYETGKHADYVAEFQPCAPSYDELLRQSQTVRFGRGTSSASMPLAFSNLFERKVFAVNARQNQTISIDAPGCKILVYLPGGGLYEYVEWKSDAGDEQTIATTVIDRMTVKTAPRSGNYLIVLQKPAENAVPQRAVFKITS